MFFTDSKTHTLRQAIARAVLKMEPETMQRIRAKTVPKGDVIELARAAGVMAAKKTPDLIPYCHPLPLDGAAVDFELEEASVVINAHAKAVWKTGVEMEALTAASVAALTLYDMLKPIDTELEITSVKLIEKSGGKSDFPTYGVPHLKAAVIVTSDGTFQGTRADKSGKLIHERLAKLGITDIRYQVLPDEREKIRNELLRLCDEGVRLILTTGGTGLSPRDVTVEATAEVVERYVPGIAEAMRSFGQQRTPYAMLSRGVVGVRGKTLIINLPGSSKGVTESLDAIFPHVLHGFKMMGGGGH